MALLQIEILNHHNTRYVYNITNDNFECGIYSNRAIEYNDINYNKCVNIIRKLKLKNKVKVIKHE